MVSTECLPITFAPSEGRKILKWNHHMLSTIRVLRPPSPSFPQLPLLKGNSGFLTLVCCIPMRHFSRFVTHVYIHKNMSCHKPLIPVSALALELKLPASQAQPLLPNPLSGVHRSVTSCSQRISVPGHFRTPWLPVLSYKLSYACYKLCAVLEPAWVLWTRTFSGYIARNTAKTRSSDFILRDHFPAVILSCLCECSHGTLHKTVSGVSTY